MVHSAHLKRYKACVSKRHNCVDSVAGADDRGQELPHNSVKGTLSSKKLFQSAFEHR